jgi:hypothetical protein
MSTTSGASPRDNADTSIKQDFFNYTSARWIFNEKKQLDARHVQFSVSSLKRVAEEVAQSTCTGMVKLPEGLFNRAFILQFSNGEELIARIPTPIAGPKRYMTASEVATIKLMEKVGIPVPKILAYSCQEDAVGCEYIIMEKAKGQPLKAQWSDMTEKRRIKMIAELIAIQKQILGIEFGAYGSLYMKEDVDFYTLPLNDMEGFEDFRIGMSMNRGYWKAERETMAIDRGPCMSSCVS